MERATWIRANLTRLLEHARTPPTEGRPYSAATAALIAIDRFGLTVYTKGEYDAVRRDLEERLERTAEAAYAALTGQDRLAQAAS